MFSKIHDPDFYDQLYTRTGRRDKYSYIAGRFGYASDCFSTNEHEIHRLRRKALSPMFSVKKIDEFEPVIVEKVEKFCQKIAAYEDGQVLPLDRALMALTTDVITEYAKTSRFIERNISPIFEPVSILFQTELLLTP